MRIFETALLLTAVFAVTKRDDHYDSKDNKIEHLSVPLALQHPIPSASLFFKKKYSLMTDKIIDEKYIGEFIVGTPEQREVLTKILVAMYKSNDEFASSIDFVFRYLEGFHIAVNSGDKIEKLNNNFEAVYAPKTRTLIASDYYMSSDPVKYFKGMVQLRHEFNHAVMHAVQIQNGNPNSMECYFPNNKEERAKVSKMIDDGNQNLENLEKNLDKEAKNQLSKKECSHLKQLRSQVRTEYNKYYKLSFTSSSAQGAEALQQIFGLELKPGRIINIDKHVPLLWGDLLVHKVELEENQSSIKKITFFCEDPLRAACAAIREAQNNLKKFYPPENHLFEFRAHLEGNLPQKLIQYLYPELHSYTNNLVQQCLVKPVPRNLFLHNYSPEYLKTFKQILKEEVVGDLIKPNVFNANDVESYMNQAKAYAVFGRIATAQDILKALIKRGYFVGEANLELARIEFNANDFKKAVAYFKRADKRKTRFEGTDRYMYSKALVETGNEKASRKQYYLISAEKHDTASLPKQRM